MTNVIRNGAKLQATGAIILRYSLVFFLLFFGSLKWTLEEAKAIEPVVSHSPLTWTGHFGVRGASEFVGVIELALGTLIALRRWNPRLSSWSSLGAVGMFLVTLSFLFTTPNVSETAPFLLKDVGLLGSALWTAGEALQANKA